MAWAAVAGAAIGAVGSSMGSKGSGGGGGQTASKEPWAEAAPWLKENLKIGQDLQSRYSANPFSDMQKLAYGRQFGDSDYFRNVTGSMLGQLNGQRPFDRNNPDARPTPFQFPSMTSGVMGAGGQAGGMGSGMGGSGSASPFSSGVFATPQPAPQVQAAPKAYQPGDDDPQFQEWRRMMTARGGGHLATWDMWPMFGGRGGERENAGPGVGAGDGGGY